MKVPHSEGVANHTDPLSCVGHSGGIRQSVAGGEHPAIEPGKLFQPVRRRIGSEGDMDGRDIAKSGPIPRGQRPWQQKLLVPEPGEVSQCCLPPLN